MRLRFCLYRMGANPETTEIDEAAELVKLYYEERGQQFCPLSGIT